MGIPCPVLSPGYGSMLSKPAASPRELPQDIVTHPDVASVTLGVSLEEWDWPCRGCRCCVPVPWGSEAGWDVLS